MKNKITTVENSAIKWEIVSLKDICSEINYGLTASATTKNTGYKFLRITDIVPDSINWSSVPYCEISRQQFEKYKLQQNDIVIARTGATTGYAKIIKNDCEVVFASYLVRIRISEENDAHFISKIIESDIYKKFIQSQLTGSAQPQANAQVLTSFKITLPPISIQKKISSILSTYDDLISLNETRIKILEEMAQRLYTEWFVKFRFPGHEDVKMIDSGTEFGMIPEGWEISNIGKLAEIQNGFAFKSSQWKESGSPVIRIKNIDNQGRVNLNDCAFIDKNDHIELKKFELNTGDLVMAMTGATIGKIGIIPRSNEKIYLNQRVCVFKIKHLFKSSEF